MTGFVVREEVSPRSRRSLFPSWLSLGLGGLWASLFFLLNAINRGEDALELFRVYGWPFKPAVIWLHRTMDDTNMIKWSADVVKVGQYRVALRYVALDFLILVLGIGLVSGLAEFALRKARSRIDSSGSLGWFLRPVVSLRTLVILILAAGALLYPYVSAVQESLQYQGRLNFASWEVPILVLAPVAILAVLGWFLERGRN